MRFFTKRPSMTPKAAMLATLGLMWLNYAFTARWAPIAGSIHGAKEPIFVVLLGLTSILAVRSWPEARAPLGPIASIMGGVGILVLAALLFVWFPPATWTEIPFLDNWPARYQSTTEGIALLKRGAVVGWQWNYLGGYQLSSDLTQSHTTLGFVPMALFGPAVGFHVLHAGLFLAIPALILWDLRSEDHDTRWIAAGLSAILTCGFSYFLLRSGDTNSLAGLVCLAVALAASHDAARDARWGAPVLVTAVALLNYVHAGFVVYTALFLVLEAVFYRDRARLRRALIVTACGFAAGLPLHWESWRYPNYFIPNNVIFDANVPFELLPLVRKIYYNVELLWLPGRWFNDFSGLSTLCLPIIAFVAWRVRSRAGLYAWLALATLAALRLNTPEFAYLFLRPIHVLVLCMGPVLAVFVSRFVASKTMAVAFPLLAAVYLQVLVFHVPHIPSLRDADPTLVEHVVQLDGALVLVENTPHRDMDADPSRTTQPPPFDVHLEQGLAAAAGRRLYAGLWDGWQWSPYRDQVLAGGAFKGRALPTVPIGELTSELKKWGIRHLLVWSDAAQVYFRQAPSLFAERWTAGAWHDFEYLDADTRAATSTEGTATLAAFDPLAARVHLQDVRARSLIVVRTNYHPSWTAAVAGTNARLQLFNQNGQLAFLAPNDGSYDVHLKYPRRLWTWLVAVTAVILGCAILARSGSNRRAMIASSATELR